MTEKELIVIFDDEREGPTTWKRELEGIPELQERFDIITPGAEDFHKDFEVLETRHQDLRRTGAFSADQTCFDRAAVLIVDFDLAFLSSKESLTGERVAYLARCFSSCGLIIGLNQFGPNTFDLSLRGRIESFADLNIGGRHLTSFGLWVDRVAGFRPWHWPVVPLAVDAFRRRVSALENELNSPILRYLEFPEEVVQAMPRSVLEFLDVGGEDPTASAFTEFVFKSGEAYRDKDADAARIAFEEGKLHPRFVAGIAAARIGKWLERVVLPGQALVVDAPHLVERFPSLLNTGGQANEDVSIWNRTASLLSPAIHTDLIAPFHVQCTDWFWRPVWFWPPMTRYEGIKENADPWSFGAPPYVFCEDTSMFVEREQAHAFVADVPSSFARRYVARITDVDYRPAVRLAL